MSPTVTIGVQRKPAASVGTISIEMPRCFGASGSVRQASQMKSAWLAPDVNTLLPLTIHVSPSSRADVRSDARSVPAPGSV